MRSGKFLLVIGRPSLLALVSVFAGASVSTAMPVVCGSPACAVWSKPDKSIGHSTRDEVLARGSMHRNGAVGQPAKMIPDGMRDFVEGAALLATRMGSTDDEPTRTDDQKASPHLPLDWWRWLTKPELRPESWRYENWKTSDDSDGEGKSHHRIIAKWISSYHHGGGWNGDSHGQHFRERIWWLLCHLNEHEKPPVPEPGTALVVALGIGLLALRRHRSR